MRFLVALVLIVLLGVGAAWVIAGRGGGPTITINQPAKFVGQAGTLEVTVDTPKGTLNRFEAYIEQQGRRIPLATSLNAAGVQMTQAGADRIVIRRELGKRSVPELQAGDARITVIAARPASIYNVTVRTLESSVSRDVRVRFEAPRVSVVSVHHFVNHGGAEFIVYRATPSDVESGVKVGDLEYRGFPAADAAPLAGARFNDPSLKVAFFALLHDQDLNTPISLYARDEAGNTARADFDYKVFPKPMRKSRIELPDQFIDRVVPAILEHTPDLKADGPVLDQFLKINSELRRRNAEQIGEMGRKGSGPALFSGEFKQLANSQVEAAFADQRTYFYKGKEVDRQVHLGFDLATTANAPIVASNSGKVIYADYLGIYGNCVIVDHGLGLQSLYAHLSSIGVSVGQTVDKGQTIGRSGMTGLAGGDHLHFTMLVEGRMVNPVEFWDPHWLEDRVLRKLREAAAQ